MSVTTDQVKEVAGVTRDVTIFLTMAQAYYAQLLGDKGLNDGVADAIVLYLAAHFVILTTEQGGQRRMRLGESDESYRTPGDKDTGLAFTRFGQQAMILDYTGTLAAAASNKGLKAYIEVV